MKQHGLVAVVGSHVACSKNQGALMNWSRLSAEMRAGRASNGRRTKESKQIFVASCTNSTILNPIISDSPSLIDFMNNIGVNKLKHASNPMVANVLCLSAPEHARICQNILHVDLHVPGSAILGN